MNLGLFLLVTGLALFGASFSTERPGETELMPVTGSIMDVRRAERTYKSIKVLTHYNIDMRTHEGRLLTVRLPRAQINGRDLRRLVGQPAEGLRSKSNYLWALKSGEKDVLTYQRAMKTATTENNELTGLGASLIVFGLMFLVSALWRGRAWV